jgi:hypothetical protein
MNTLQTMRHCPICGKATLHIYNWHGCNHILHLLLTLCTGFWLIIWFFAALGEHSTKPVCTICGDVMPQEMKERLLAERAERLQARRTKCEELKKRLQMQLAKWAKRISESCERFIDWSDKLSDKAWIREHNDK